MFPNLYTGRYSQTAGISLISGYWTPPDFLESWFRYGGIIPASHLFYQDSSGQWYRIQRHKVLNLVFRELNHKRLQQGSIVYPAYQRHILRNRQQQRPPQHQRIKIQRAFIKGNRGHIDCVYRLSDDKKGTVNRRIMRLQRPQLFYHHCAMKLHTLPWQPC